MTSEELPEAASSCVGEASWHTNPDLRALVCALRHPTQSPMTVGCVGALCECIEAAAIVAAAHSELVLLIIELYDDSRRFGVPEGIRQGLSRNAENLVCYVAMENIASSAALYQEINCPNRIEIRSHTISRNDHLVSSGERD